MGRIGLMEASRSVGRRGQKTTPQRGGRKDVVSDGSDQSDGGGRKTVGDLVVG